MKTRKSDDKLLRDSECDQPTVLNETHNKKLKVVFHARFYIRHTVYIQGVSANAPEGNRGLTF